MDPLLEQSLLVNRREFFGRSACGIGSAARASLLAKDGLGGDSKAARIGGLDGVPHFAPKARRVIYLFQSGGPSQMELFDPKPQLVQHAGTDLPESIRMGQRLTGMSATQSKFPVVPSRYKFEQRGQ